MKNIFSLLLLLVAWPVCAQQQLMSPLPLDAGTQLVTYTAVVPAPGVIQSSLLARARVWANRVGLAAKPPLCVSELGTDVLVVAGMQSINPTYDVGPESLYFLARVALREGRYQYRFEEFTLVTGNATGSPSFQTAETVFLRSEPPRASGSSSATRLRKAFDEAVGQAAATLHTALTTSLTNTPGTSTDW